MRAYSNSRTPESARDRRATPWWLFRQIERLLNVPIIHDVCAAKETTKCATYWGPDVGVDSLAIDWMGHEATWGRQVFPFALWMNPPYSDPGPWCEKAAAEAAKGLIVVGLLPDDRGTRWYQDHIEGVASLAFLPSRRISFLGPDGKPQNGNPKPSIIPVWTPWRTGRTEDVRFQCDEVTGEAA